MFRNSRETQSGIAQFSQIGREGKKSERFFWRKQWDPTPVPQKKIACILK